jgi:profilin
MSWSDYINQLKNKHSATGEIHDCVEKAAIIALADGSIWASTPDFGLYGYNVDVPTEDGLGVQPIEINEIDLFLHIVNHDGASNSPAGIRIANEKYFKVSSDQTEGLIYLKKNGGGACIAKCATCVVFASWNGANVTSGAHTVAQNPGLCNEQVEKLAQYLKENAF